MPRCAGKVVTDDNNLAVRFPELAAEWDFDKNRDLTPDKVMPGSDKKAWWKCNREHESYWRRRIAVQMRGLDALCVRCRLQSLNLDCFVNLHLSFRCRMAKENRQDKCDVYVPGHNFAIEYDGVYWHRNRIDEDRKKGKGLGSVA